MRPGQETPDEQFSQRVPARIRQTSMRPGQETPDERDGALAAGQAVDTSMRPGQETPDEWQRWERIRELILSLQ